MDSKKSFSTDKALSFGWNSVKKNPIIILYFMVGVALPAISSRILSLVAGDDTVINLAIQILVQSLSIIFSIGLIRVALNVYDNVPLKIENLYQDYRRVFGYFIASMLVGLGVLAVFFPFFIILGIVFFSFQDYFWILILPGLLSVVAAAYVGTRWSLWSYVFLDKGVGPIASVQASWEMTKGNVLRLFLLYIVQGLIIILGLIALIVGVLVAIPVASLMLVYAYKMLDGKKPESVSTPPAPAVS